MIYQRVELKIEADTVFVQTPLGLIEISYEPNGMVLIAINHERDIDNIKLRTLNPRLHSVFVYPSDGKDHRWLSDPEQPHENS